MSAFDPTRRGFLLGSAVTLGALVGELFPLSNARAAGSGSELDGIRDELRRGLEGGRDASRVGGGPRAVSGRDRTAR